MHYWFKSYSNFAELVELHWEGPARSLQSMLIYLFFILFCLKVYSDLKHIIGLTICILGGQKQTWATTLFSEVISLWNEQTVNSLVKHKKLNLSTQKSLIDRLPFNMKLTGEWYDMIWVFEYKALNIELSGKEAVIFFFVHQKVRPATQALGLLLFPAEAFNPWIRYFQNIWMKNKKYE